MGSFREGAPPVPADVRVVQADVPEPAYDEFRRLIYVPTGLTEQERGRLVRKLIEERRPNTT
jgi:hypothetical protein